MNRERLSGFIVPNWAKTSIQKNALASNALRYSEAYNICTGEIADRIRSLCKNRRPSISIVVPAHNEQLYILALLHSLSCLEIQQTEVLVVVNNSDDMTAEIATDCGTKVIEYKDDTRRGVSYARQIGLEQACGDFVVTTDADVVVSSKWASSLVHELQINDNVSCVTANKRHVPNSHLLFTAGYDLGRTIKMHIGSGPIAGRPTGSTMAFRRCDALEEGGYDTSLTIGEDLDIGIKLARRGKVKFLPGEEPTVWASARRLDSIDPLKLFSQAILGKWEKQYIDEGSGMMRNLR